MSDAEEVVTVSLPGRFLKRVTSLPVVSGSLTKSRSVYCKLKSSNRVIARAASLTERTLSFSARRLKCSLILTPLHMADLFAEKFLEALEERVPYIKYTPEQLLDATGINSIKALAAESFPSFSEMDEVEIPDDLNSDENLNLFRDRIKQRIYQRLFLPRKLHQSVFAIVEKILNLLLPYIGPCVQKAADSLEGQENVKNTILETIRIFRKFSFVYKKITPFLSENRRQFFQKCGGYFSKCFEEVTLLKSTKDLQSMLERNYDILFEVLIEIAFRVALKYFDLITEKNQTAEDPRSAEATSETD